MSLGNENYGQTGQQNNPQYNQQQGNPSQSGYSQGTNQQSGYSGGNSGGSWLGQGDNNFTGQQTCGCNFQNGKLATACTTHQQMGIQNGITLEQWGQKVYQFAGAKQQKSQGNQSSK